MRRPDVRARLPACAGAFLLIAAGAFAQSSSYTPLADARSVLAQLRAPAPSGLPALSGTQADAQWRTWIAAHDRGIRARLAEGEEDTLVNWILLGTSFTSHPPARLDGSMGMDATAMDRAVALIQARVEDVIRALAAPGGDERRLVARRLLESRGLALATAAGQAGAREYLIRAIQRVVSGGSAQAASARTTPTSEFEARGLSLDTSISPNFALHESLAAMKARGLLAPGSIRRVAIVGAGLDFADKNTGFDFYPVQTMQPFAVLDALRRLALAPAGGGEQLVAFDISPRVIDHVVGARASANDGYLLRLPISRRRPWLPRFREYWQTFGDRIGGPVPAAAPARLPADAEVRTVRVGREALTTLSAADLNVIVQRPDGERFDLVIATNVLLYYGGFDQALALSNIAAMLKTGGFLLTNTALPEAAGMRRAGSLRTLYTEDNTGDEIVWYAAPDSKP